MPDPYSTSKMLMNVWHKAEKRYVGWCWFSHEITCALHQNVSLFLIQQSSKLRHILDIWSAGYGVVSLHVFYNTTAEEAFTREACMIDAMGEKSHTHSWIKTKKKNSNCSELLFYLHKKSCTAYSSSIHVSRLIFRLSRLRNFHHIMYTPSLSFLRSGHDDQCCAWPATRRCSPVVSLSQETLWCLPPPQSTSCLPYRSTTTNIPDWPLTSETISFFWSFFTSVVLWFWFSLYTYIPSHLIYKHVLAWDCWGTSSWFRFADTFLWSCETTCVQD